MPRFNSRWMAIARNRAIVGTVALACLVAKGDMLAAQTVSTGENVGDAAVVEAEPVVASPETASAALVKGNTTQAVALYSQVLRSGALTREKRAILLNDRGVALWRSGRAKDAIADFNKAVQLYPEYAAIYNNRGTVLLGLGLVDESVKDFDRAILLGPRYATAYTNRAGAHVRRQDLDKAFQDYNQAAELRPSDAVAFLGRGRTHLASRRPFAAERDFTKGISLAPKLVEIYASRAEARLRIGRRSAAIEDMNQMVTLSSNTASVYADRGKALLSSGDRGGALRDFNKALELDEGLVEAHVGRARALLAFKDAEKALSSLETALLLQPNAADLHAARAAALRMAGQVDGALRAAQRALKRDKRNVDALIVQAQIFESQDNVERAIALYKKAYVVAPSNGVVRKALRRLRVADPLDTTKVVYGSGLDGWQVLAPEKGRYIAVNEMYPRLVVPLEMYGSSKPRILDWELKAGVFRDIGVLRYAAGRQSTGDKAVAVEQAAIIDLRDRVVHGEEPVRVGRKVALWNWEDGTLTVRGTDGLVSRFALRRSRAQAIAAARNKRRAVKSDWLADPWGFNQGAVQQRKPKRRAKRRKRKKKKSLFNLIFQ